MRSRGATRWRRMERPTGMRITWTRTNWVSQWRQMGDVRAFGGSVGGCVGVGFVLPWPFTLFLAGWRSRFCPDNQAWAPPLPPPAILFTIRYLLLFFWMCFSSSLSFFAGRAFKLVNLFLFSLDVL